MAIRKPKQPDIAEVPAPVTSPDIVEAEAGGLLSIDLAAIVANWRTLAQMTMPIDCAAVVKSDAYGCGIEPVASSLMTAGATTFFVADLSEARRLRALSHDITIYVLNGVLPNTAPAFADANARPVINSLTELAEWDAFVTSAEWHGGAALHVDTGINRLGVTPEDAVALAPRIKGEHHGGIKLLMSHLACAETPEHPLNDKQVRLFREVRLHYRGIPSSLANSSGIFLGPSAHCDLVRPGAALYGINPTPGKTNPMQPVVGLQGRIVQVRHVDRGDAVGYGAAWTAAGPSRIAVVAIGYGDGYARAASAGPDKPAAQAIVGGQLCPLVGRVSMDLLAIDVTATPEGVARRGATAMLIGGAIDVDRLAGWTGTIGYEVLTRLGRRYHRVWTSGSEGNQG